MSHYFTPCFSTRPSVRPSVGRWGLFFLLRWAGRGVGSARVMPDIIRVYDSPSLRFPFSLSLSSHAAEEEGETDRVDGGGGMRGGGIWGIKKVGKTEIRTRACDTLFSEIERGRTERMVGDRADTDGRKGEGVFMFGVCLAQKDGPPPSIRK